MSTLTKNARELLTALGIGQWNITMIVPYMFIAPATTDPKAPQIIILVKAIQKALYELGASDVPLSGRLDVPTARALEQVAGPDWERLTWSGNVAAIVAAKESGVSLRAPPAPGGTPMAVGGPLDFLPDIPGGIVTYGVLGFLLYRSLVTLPRRRREAGKGH